MNPEKMVNPDLLVLPVQPVLVDSRVCLVFLV